MHYLLQLKSKGRVNGNGKHHSHEKADKTAFSQHTFFRVFVALLCVFCQVSGINNPFCSQKIHVFAEQITMGFFLDHMQTDTSLLL